LINYKPKLVKVQRKEDFFMREVMLMIALGINLVDLVEETTKNSQEDEILYKNMMTTHEVKVAAQEIKDHEKILVEVAVALNQEEGIDQEAEAETDTVVGKKMAHIIKFKRE
jgi:hypothetical protein